MCTILGIDRQPHTSHIDMWAPPIYTHTRNVALIAEVIEIKRRKALADDPKSVRRGE